MRSAASNWTAWLMPGSDSRRAPGMSIAISSCMAGGTMRSACGTTTSVGAVMAPRSIGWVAAVSRTKRRMAASVPGRASGST